MNNCKTIILYFGSFNPIHKGHLALANAALSELKLTENILGEVWFVLSAQNPFKKQANLWPDNKRAELIRQAIFAFPNFKFCEVELQLPKPSYTIVSLDFLHQTYPTNVFYLLMGEDNLSQLHLWKDYSRILTQHKIMVYPRENHAVCQETASKDYPILREYPNQILWLKQPLINISSSEIRNKIKNGEDVADLLP
ncbi:MAG: nicotinate (nicotinamide) nucleotide adenylyltransferase [Bacteroidales bacterium]